MVLRNSSISWLKKKKKILKIFLSSIKTSKKFLKKKNFSPKIGLALKGLKSCHPSRRMQGKMSVKPGVLPGFILGRVLKFVQHAT